MSEETSDWVHGPTTPALCKKMWYAGNGWRGRKGEVIKSRIPKEAIGGVS